MKKIFYLVFVFVLSFSYDVSAQVLDWSKPEKPVTFGIRYGINFAGLANPYTGQYKSYEAYEDVNVELVGNDTYKSGRKSINLGLSVDFNINKSFAIATGAYYSVKGCVMTSSQVIAGPEVLGDKKNPYLGVGWDMEESTTQAYFHIPVCASLRFWANKDLKFHLDAGGYMSYIVGGSVKFESSSESLKDEDDKNYEYEEDYSNDGRHKFDAGLRFGVAATWKRLYLGAHYELGLTRLYSSSHGWMAKSGDYANYKDERNKCLSVDLGFNF